MFCKVFPLPFDVAVVFIFRTSLENSSRFFQKNRNRRADILHGIDTRSGHIKEEDNVVH
jgi:hypothetical protein